jgi:hypothetical protein
MAAPHLNHQHARILQEFFAHPLPHNIEWNDVVSLFQHVGSVTERHDGKFEFQVGSAKVVFTKPHGKDLSADDVVALRRLLNDAGITPQ